ncbi:MAG TPA: RsmB/NOP family class I SAM-dependent RNA methyltransferase, partial [Candidatus Synoicihabitans sp.]|nr:RsmB/NOP family class I SAM-dependent RNA methyltransferase [Candidatus Synoicihabitans sp.]
MSDSPTINRAARVLARASPQLPADAALREELVAMRQLSPAEKRALSRAVFVYFRWWRWLETGASIQTRLAAALDLQARFDHDPGSVKSEALAARALPDWAREEIAFQPEDLRALQRDPALWIRGQREFAASVARVLGHCAPAPGPAAGTGFRYTG